MHFRLQLCINIPKISFSAYNIINAKVSYLQIKKRLQKRGLEGETQNAFCLISFKIAQFNTTAWIHIPLEYPFVNTFKATPQKKIQHLISFFNVNAHIWVSIHFKFYLKTLITNQTE